jgi:ATP dependent DNA ligase domain
MLQRALTAGFVWPCLPTKANRPPSGELWIHEIKHDGFRIIARKNGERVRLYSRADNDLTHHFPMIVDALARLRSRHPSTHRRRGNQHCPRLLLRAALMEIRGFHLSGF